MSFVVNEKKKRNKNNDKNYENTLCQSEKENKSRDATRPIWTTKCPWVKELQQAAGGMEAVGGTVARAERMGVAVWKDGTTVVTWRKK